MLRHGARDLVRANAHRYARVYNARGSYAARLQRLCRAVHEEEFFVLKQMRKRDPLVFDVGANVGQSIVSIKRLLPNARVISFEPSLPAFERCIRLAKGFESVDVLPLACATTSGRVLSLSTPTARGVRFSQLASLEEKSSTGVAEFLRANGFRWVKAADLAFVKQLVVTVALDDIDERPDVIKIDVEGAELLVLQGATRHLTCQDPSPIVIIEAGGRPEVLRMMHAAGYSPYGPHGLNSVFSKPAMHSELKAF